MSANKVTLSNHCEKCEKETTREGKELEDEYKIHTHHYGNIQYSTICKIFGDELTYNELKPYADDPEEYGFLTVETLKIKGNNKMLVTAWVDIDKIMEKKFDLYRHYDMFYYFDEMDDMFYYLDEMEDLDEDEDEEEEEEEEEEEPHKIPDEVEWDEDLENMF